MSNKVKLNITMRRPSSCNSCPFNKKGWINEPNWCGIHPSKSVDIYKASTPKEGISDTCPLYATDIVDMVADVGEFGYYYFEVVGGKNDNSPSSKTCSNCKYCSIDDEDEAYFRTISNLIKYFEIDVVVKREKKR